MNRILSKNWPQLVLAFCVAFALSFFGASALRMFIFKEETIANIDTGENKEEYPVVIPDFINLQPTADNWASSLPKNAKVSLIIYDLDNDRLTAEYNPDVVMSTASVYKLFFAYDGYRQISDNLADPDEYFTTTEKGRLTYGDCLDLIIRESYNGCAEPLRTDQFASVRVTELIDELGLQNTTNLGLSSTATDLLKLMQLYYDHSEINPDLWEKIKDSMLNQPATTYDWRQGLPSGFSQALVYDKVGWDYNGSIWNIYNDVAFLEFPEFNRHYIVIALTSGLPTFEPLVKLGQELEQVVIDNSEEIPNVDIPKSPNL